jgi:hypothetical protein
VSSRIAPLRSAGRAALAVLLVLLASGFVRFRGDLEVGRDDTVSGTLVVAVQDPSGSLQPPDPPPLADPLGRRVTVAGYHGDGYVGSEYTLRRLPFDDFDDLVRQAAAFTLPGLPGVPGLSPGSAGGEDAASTPTIQMSLRREGGEIRLSGAFYLPLPEGVTTDGDDARLSVTFPGEVVSSTGTRAGRTASWTFGAGQRQPVEAVARVSGPVGAWVRYAPVAGGVAVLLLLGGLLLLTVRRHRGPRTAGGPPTPAGPPPGPPAAPALRPPPPTPRRPYDPPPAQEDEPASTAPLVRGYVARTPEVGGRDGAEWPRRNPWAPPDVR